MNEETGRFAGDAIGLVIELAVRRPAAHHVQAACQFCGHVCGHWDSNAQTGIRTWKDESELPDKHADGCLWRKARELVARSM